MACGENLVTQPMARLQPRMRDITGHRIGLLQAVKFLGTNGRRAVWLIRCDCGIEKQMQLRRFLADGVTSCGCRKDDHKRMPRPELRTHGLSKHPAYAVWRSMRDRCRLPTHHAYDRYGGRGIAVCERWRTFEMFWEDMGPTYQAGLTLERKDNDKGYNPENCVWETRLAQAHNTRANITLETPWGLMTAGEAADKAGINRTTIYYRIAHGVPMSRLWDPPDVTNRF